MNQSENINELAAALSKAQGEINPALKDSVNPFFKSKYADLSSIWNACKEALTKHQLSVLQTMDVRDGQLILITTLAHASGQWIRSILPILSAKQDAQGIGSAITYMRRYSLAALVGVTTEDDDGNAASEEWKPVKAKVTSISSSEAQELENLLKQSGDIGFIQNVKNYLKSINVSSFYELPQSQYKAIRDKIVNKLESLNESNEEVLHA